MPQIPITRKPLILSNKRGYNLICSHYEPAIRPCQILPCIVYLHGNSSCQMEGRQILPYLLTHSISLFAFDFSGCGLSGGDYISLGYHQRDDVDAVWQYLRSLTSVSSIGLWGRSMGAATALMYAQRNPQIACLVLDSPFSSLQTLCKQLANKHATMVSFLAGPVLYFMGKTIEEKNDFQIASVTPIKHCPQIYVPGLFVAAKEDDFIIPKHSEDLHAAYGGEKRLMNVEGTHNTRRDDHINQQISIFIYNSLLVSQLIKPDRQYQLKQKEQYERERQKRRRERKEKQRSEEQQKKKLKLSEMVRDIDQKRGLGIKADVGGSGSVALVIGNNNKNNRLSQLNRRPISTERIKSNCQLECHPGDSADYDQSTLGTIQQDRVRSKNSYEKQYSRQQELINFDRVFLKPNEDDFIDIHQVSSLEDHSQLGTQGLTFAKRLSTKMIVKPSSIDSYKSIGSQNSLSNSQMQKEIPQIVINHTKNKPLIVPKLPSKFNLSQNGFTDKSHNDPQWLTYVDPVQVKEDQEPKDDQRGCQAK